MEIEKLDSNFAVHESSGEDLDWYSCPGGPFQVFGLLPPSDGMGFLRMPAETAGAIRPELEALNRHTAGGRLRFVTDSQQIHLKASMAVMQRMSHFALTGSAGFDLYEMRNGRERYVKTVIPPYDAQGGFSGSIQFKTPGPHAVTIHFPLYSSVEALYIGLTAGSAVWAHTPYQHAAPVVYYGSSITQGGCASRPGNAYPNILSRELNCDHINLGFSGNARGEPEMAAYLASMSMSAFVMDYDYNAPNCDHLTKTHQAMFTSIRDAQPKLPILILSRPSAALSQEEQVRQAIIRRTCACAVSEGDKHVCFVDGSQMFALFGGDGATVDGIHPNDLGFVCMAKALEPAVRWALGKALPPPGTSGPRHESYMR